MLKDKYKYILLSIIFALLIYFACQFYLTQGSAVIFTFLPGDAVTQGVALIIAIGAIVSLLYYYRAMSKKTAAINTPLGAELSAYSIIAEDLIKNTYISMPCSIDEINQLRNYNKIYIGLDRFNIAFKIGDRIRLSSGNDIYNPFIDCEVKNIDSSNKIAELTTLFIQKDEVTTKIIL